MAYLEAMERRLEPEHKLSKRTWRRLRTQARLSWFELEGDSRPPALASETQAALEPELKLIR
ncbi:hypothetical protein N7481_012988 [Penicillium waksmanii]|uniref:uncharacterized protein n=1 Tax=Penicillium waksmanii TaxID=69791 RepID=UPI0025499C40|nr:uncharacterized protein N7481_012988 [Penicillium waksmanii]KAJ5966274.1 hypothetical protein N7481_012988 [Penicillium waksmanii]